ncbi:MULTISPECIES: hypothetical protein [Enterococcus]|uniref:hypothetical protein n=1 Tax=Enterococcus TaxID=1350 RepID=UPI000B5A549F|nr:MULTISPECIES: hypothetical protein [Enterococcus]
MTKKMLTQHLKKLQQVQQVKVIAENMEMLEAFIDETMRFGTPSPLSSSHQPRMIRFKSNSRSEKK